MTFTSCPLFHMATLCRTLLSTLACLIAMPSLQAETYTSQLTGHRVWSNLVWSPTGTPGIGDSIKLSTTGTYDLFLQADRQFESLTTSSTLLIRAGSSGSGSTITNTLTLGTITATGGSLFFANNTAGAVLSVTTENLVVEGSATSVFLGRNAGASFTTIGSFTVTGQTEISGFRLVMQTVSGDVNLGRVVNHTKLDLANSVATDGSNLVVNVRGITGGAAASVTTSNDQAAVRPTLRIDGMSLSTVETYAGNVTDGESGTSSKVKVEKGGLGTQIFSRSNGLTYSGGTEISGGTLAVTNTSGSGLGSGSVVVSGSGVLAGTGRIALAADEKISVASGASISPGLAGSTEVGTLTLVGNADSTAPILEMASGSSFIFRLGTTDQSDSLSLTKSQATGLSLGLGGIEVHLELLSGSEVPVDDFTLFTFDNISQAELEAIVTRLTLAPSGSFTGVLNTTFDNRVGTIFVTTEAIPEPGVYASLLGGALLVWMSGRRKR